MNYLQHANTFVDTIVTTFPVLFEADDPAVLTDEVQEKIYELVDAMPRDSFYEFIDCIPAVPDGMWHEARTPKELNRELAFWTVVQELKRLLPDALPRLVFIS